MLKKLLVGATAIVSVNISVAAAKGSIEEGFEIIVPNATNFNSQVRSRTKPKDDKDHNFMSITADITGEMKIEGAKKSSPSLSITESTTEEIIREIKRKNSDYSYISTALKIASKKGNAELYLAVLEDQEISLVPSLLQQILHPLEICRFLFSEDKMVNIIDSAIKFRKKELDALFKGNREICGPGNYGSVANNNELVQKTFKGSPLDTVLEAAITSGYDKLFMHMLTGIPRDLRPSDDMIGFAMAHVFFVRGSYANANDLFLSVKKCNYGTISISKYFIDACLKEINEINKKLDNSENDLLKRRELLEKGYKADFNLEEISEKHKTIQTQQDNMKTMQETLSGMIGF